ncbi:MAG: [protein-PII] uridylyltransferase [Verrucomicrobia bacterium]|jgi:[protein-PII] uridylyltransferase|nr:[protein-PII] uridylyltransferase [Verrucomicrobiota bacterium]
MQDLLKKIEADAGARLTLPPGRAAGPEIARFRAFLKLETHRLKLAHRNGAGGLEICQARSAILDHVIRYLWIAALNTLSAQARKEFPPITVVALGGYGRSELNPHSDIDLMFLHEGQVAGHLRPLPVLEKVMNGVWLPLFDLGLKPGHSVRSIADCVAAANARNDARSMETKTSFLEARLIIGDEKLFAGFQKAVLAKCVAGYETKYIAARLEDQAARRAKFGNSACMQEPNLKNGCGGLRDFQNLLWMAFFKSRIRSLQELEQHDLVSEKERKQLEAAYDFLLRVRTELHYHVNRAMDVLSKNLQPAVAHNLGYTERSPSKRIEEFMRDLYTHARNIFLITRTLEQRLALLPLLPSRLSLRSYLPNVRRRAVGEPVDGLKFINGEIHAASNRIFRDQPRRLMRVFLEAQKRGLRLHPDLAQLIRNQLALVDREFLADAHVRETFLTILNQRGNVAPILRAMHEVDLLGKYLPEFGKLTCLVQHEFYHQYTADEHTLVCLEQLDRIWEAKESPYETYAQMFQGLERPFLLYLALLLHDVGKANSHGNHSEVGGALAARVARRLALDAAATHTLRTVIEHHLLMANISQRRDLDDPTVIRHFARQMEHPEILTLLTLHTFVDTQATSDKLWNGFKDALLQQLHARTLPLLTGGADFVRAEEKQRELLMQEAHELLREDLSEEELHAHFAKMPPRYFQIHSAPEILNDLELAHTFMRVQVTGDHESLLAPAVHWRNDPDRGCSAVKICTWDRAGLFSQIAGSLSAAGLTILSAQIFTRSDAIVLDTFFVADAKTGNLADAEQGERFERLLGQLLTGGDADLPALIARQQITRPLYQAYLGERIPTQIRFDNDASETRTLVEIETEDLIGLLYAIAQTLTVLQLDISTARICTEKGAAIDSFYVHEIGGGKIVSPERQKSIERRLRQAIHNLEKAE